MRRIVADERVALYVEGRTGGQFHPPFSVMGIERDGEVRAGMVFVNWTCSDIHMSAAGEPGAWSKSFLREVGRYVYGQLGCLRMTVLTEQPAVVRLAERLGGKVEGVKRDHFGPGRDATMVGILAGEWRFR